ncbi:extracellular solute-binding protein [Paenibacillus mesophilus]|uniref:ABC transporter substrate-binding protein n=1 Tax=Paenibacillus mesophilus TaxID=2582849 RepID=UPI00110D5D33|nr:extracellular solute-binding protein [Paenibacillus mesophilus]TMV43752.1 extracellular solute-binding protein [Paenibacillus mesophilus]
MRNLLYAGTLSVSLVALLTACSGSDHSRNKSNAVESANTENKPIELKLHFYGVTEAEFNDRFRDALQRKFPHITFIWLPSSGAQNTLPETIARGEVPDIVRNIASTVHSSYLNMGLGYDLNEMVKKYKYDLSRFNPIFIKGLMDLTSQNGELYGLPVSPFFSRVLYYNKDLFDKFGQPYLKDGMTWEEIYEVAQKLTRVENGVVYRGFSANITTLIAYNEYSAPALHPEKDELYGYDIWKKIFDNYTRFYKIPNNSVGKTINEEAAVFQKGSVAIHSDIFSPYLNLGMLPNWDMASIPIIEGAPKKIGIFSPGYLMITKQSKHKDEAFKVIMEMLNDEVQLKDARNGFLPTVSNKEHMKVLGQDNDLYKGKNMKSVDYYEFASVRLPRARGMTPIDTSTADSFLRNAFLSAANGQQDVNTSLRNADELLRKEVEKEKSKMK